MIKEENEKRKDFPIPMEEKCPEEGKKFSSARSLLAC